MGKRGGGIDAGKQEEERGRKEEHRLVEREYREAQEARAKLDEELHRLREEVKRRKVEKMSIEEEEERLSEDERSKRMEEEEVRKRHAWVVESLSDDADFEKLSRQSEELYEEAKKIEREVYEVTKRRRFLEEEVSKMRGELEKLERQAEEVEREAAWLRKEEEKRAIVALAAERGLQDARDKLEKERERLHVCPFRKESVEELMKQVRGYQTSRSCALLTHYFPPLPPSVCPPAPPAAPALWYPPFLPFSSSSSSSSFSRSLLTCSQVHNHRKLYRMSLFLTRSCFYKSFLLLGINARQRKLLKRKLAPFFLRPFYLSFHSLASYRDQQEEKRRNFRTAVSFSNRNLLLLNLTTWKQAVEEGKDLGARAAEPLRRILLLLGLQTAELSLREWRRRTALNRKAASLHARHWRNFALTCWLEHWDETLWTFRQVAEKCKKFLLLLSADFLLLSFSSWRSRTLLVLRVRAYVREEERREKEAVVGDWRLLVAETKMRRGLQEEAASRFQRILAALLRDSRRDCFYAWRRRAAGRVRAGRMSARVVEGEAWRRWMEGMEGPGPAGEHEAAMFPGVEEDGGEEETRAAAVEERDVDLDSVFLESLCHAGRARAGAAGGGARGRVEARGERGARGVEAGSRGGEEGARADAGCCERVDQHVGDQSVPDPRRVGRLAEVQEEGCAVLRAALPAPAGAKDGPAVEGGGGEEAQLSKHLEQPSAGDKEAPAEEEHGADGGGGAGEEDWGEHGTGEGEQSPETHVAIYLVVVPAVVGPGDSEEQEVSSGAGGGGEEEEEEEAAAVLSSLGPRLRRPELSPPPSRVAGGREEGGGAGRGERAPALPQQQFDMEQQQHTQQDQKLRQEVVEDGGPRGRGRGRGRTVEGAGAGAGAGTGVSGSTWPGRHAGDTEDAGGCSRQEGCNRSSSSSSLSSSRPSPGPRDEPTPQELLRWIKELHPQVYPPTPLATHREEEGRRMEEEEEKREERKVEVSWEEAAEASCSKETANQILPPYLGGKFARVGVEKLRRQAKSLSYSSSSSSSLLPDISRSKKIAEAPLAKVKQVNPPLPPPPSSPAPAPPASFFCFLLVVVPADAPCRI
eukprot:768623-Hanusia_phi.AAC.3